MSRARLAALAGCVAAVVVLAPTADAKPKKAAEVSSEISSSHVAVGERFVVTLRIKGTDQEPNVGRPSLSIPADIVELGSTVGSHTYIINGRVSRGVDAIWNLKATRPGRFTIPGPTATVNGKKVTTGAMTIEVIAGASPNPQGTSGNSFPFPNMPNFPGMPKMPWPFGDVEPNDEPQRSSQRTDLDMKEAPPDARAFIRAIVDKPNAVVGEQVTVRYYIYCAVSCIPEQSKDPDFVSFRRMPLDRGEPEEPIGDAHVHGELYKVKLEGRSALFPLASGDLPVGAMQLNVRGRRFAPAGEPRVSNTPVVHVTEPPMAGRPPGYAVGDVGVYALTTSVQPRKLDLGGSIAVTVRISGTGLVPDAVHVPERSGVEWLDPEKKEQIDAQGGKIQGWRTLAYVVRLKNSGTIDLGNVELPYWDPASKKYQIAKAPIGEVEVAGVAANPADPDDKPAPDEPLATLPPPRKALGAWTADAPSGALAGGRFWGLLAAPPFGLAVLAAAERARRTLKKRREEGAASPRAAAERALTQAKQAAEPRDVAAAVERAVHAAVEAACGVKSRGLLLGELGDALTAAGADPARAAQVGELLGACDAVRFIPGSAAAEATADLRKRAQELVPALLRDARASRPSPRSERRAP